MRWNLCIGGHLQISLFVSVSFSLALSKLCWDLFSRFLVVIIIYHYNLEVFLGLLLHFLLFIIFKIPLITQLYNMLNAWKSKSVMEYLITNITLRKMIFIIYSWFWIEYRPPFNTFETLHKKLTSFFDDVLIHSRKYWSFYLSKLNTCMNV